MCGSLLSPAGSRFIFSPSALKMKIKLRNRSAPSRPLTGQGGRACPISSNDPKGLRSLSDGRKGWHCSCRACQPKRRSEVSSPLEEIRCRICDSALSVVGMLGGSEHGGMLPGSSEVQLENDGSGHYFRCPYCSARNVTIVTTAREWPAGRAGCLGRHER